MLMGVGIPQSKTLLKFGTKLLDRLVGIGHGCSPIKDEVSTGTNLIHVNHRNTATSGRGLQDMSSARVALNGIRRCGYVQYQINR